MRTPASILFVAVPPASAMAVRRIDSTGRSVLETAQTLKRGQYIWAPEASPAWPTGLGMFPYYRESAIGLASLLTGSPSLPDWRREKIDG
jgi:hypothetical protein